MNESYWARATQTRINRRRVLAGAGSASLAAALLAACGGSSSGTNSSTQSASSLITKPADTSKQAKRGGVYASSRSADIDHSDPHITTQQAPGTAMTYSRLFRRKPGYLAPQPVEFIGDLTDTYEFNGDKSQLTIKLKQTKWHPIAPVNARPLDAQDVAFTWKRLEAMGANRSLLANSVSPAAPIQSVTAVDNQTVVIKTAFPSPALIPLLSGSISGYFWMLPREAESQYDPRKTAIGTGHWYVSEYTPSSHINFKRNEGWYDAAKMNLAELDEPIVSEYATGLAQFKTGAIYGPMGASGGLAVKAEDVLQTKQDVPQLDLYLNDPGSEGNFAFFGWNPAYGDAAPFRDKRLRQALSMSIDRDLFIDTFYNVKKFTDAGIPMQTNWNSAITTVWPGWWVDPRGTGLGADAKNYQFNLDAAKKLVAASGYSGQEIKAQYPLTGYSGDFVNRVQVVMNFAAAAGINLKTAAVNFNTDWRPKVAEALGDFEGISFRPDAAANLPDCVEFCFSLYHNQGGVNYTGFFSEDSSFKNGDPRLNDLLANARKEFDDQKRIAAIQQLQKIVADEMYLVRFPGAANSFVTNWPIVRNVQVYTGELIGLQEWLDPTRAPVGKT